jgi:hypothetical protein
LLKNFGSQLAPEGGFAIRNTGHGPKIALSESKRLNCRYPLELSAKSHLIDSNQIMFVEEITGVLG